jgi:transcriptional regulator with XRE-family HTH domain
MALPKHEELRNSSSTANLANNVLHLMEKNNVSDSKLARALELPYNTIKRITSGETTDPKISTLTLIADFFGIGIDKLLGNETYTSQALYKKPSMVPVLSWKDLESPDSLKNINYGSWGNWQPVALSSSQKLGSNAYALKSKKSMEPRFPTGTTFIIDPDENSEDGDIVLIQIIETGEISLRELEIDPPSRQLCSINGSSPPIQLINAQHKIIGVSVLTIFNSR